MLMCGQVSQDNIPTALVSSLVVIQYPTQQTSLVLRETGLHSILHTIIYGQVYTLSFIQWYRDRFTQYPSCIDIETCLHGCGMCRDVQLPHVPCVPPFVGPQINFHKYIHFWNSVWVLTYLFSSINGMFHMSKLDLHKADLFKGIVVFSSY